MSTELTFTMLTALLAACLWIPYIVGVNSNEFEGQAESFVRPPDHRLMPAWVHRAHRAHLNLLEQFLPFAIIVVIGHLAGAISGWFGILAIAFFALRCVHAVGMISGWTQMPLRPLIFTTGFGITIAYGVLVLLN
ncbi:MAPEG family protein [Ahrensia sp. R2A130]|uniref:MAPEG family protein n=1 Tax=Ahrensia sp. R2A130 TaxID=744979 RepID=UPI0001E0BC3D|nr:MAPEG family protein [Ahrensia sp. R2A130]EFL90751.1 conserved hypothetical protein [Ahrensia sp. R2A130]